MESFIQYLIWLHAGLGVMALLAGGTSLVARKGGATHKKSGKVFYYTMMASAGIALIVSSLPGHESPFLFSIGIFSVYFLLSGYRSLKFKRRDSNLMVDKTIAYVIILTGAAMILLPIVFKGSPNIVMLVFGLAGIVFGIRDLKMLRDTKSLKKKWLRLHLGKMTGGYIAAVSAFFVVNEILPGIWNWFVPSIFGSVYIAYWMSKLKNRTD
jgi:uncharacterized membrane protein